VKKRKPKTKKRIYVIVGNGSYGLYCGEVDALKVRDGQILVYNCRHVRYWYGGTGGITSLAKWGPRGGRAQESQIGAPCPQSLILDVRAVHACTEEAIEAFSKIVPSNV